MFSPTKSFLSVAILLGAVTFSAPVVPAQTIPQAMDAAVSANSDLRFNRWGILFESEDGSTEYYSRNPDTPYIPASVAKLFTTAAAIELLGADYAFQTQVYYTGSLSGVSPNRTVTGDLVIIVGHDPTWNTSVSNPVRRGLDRIATRVRNAGISQVNGRVVVRGASFYNLESTATAHSNFVGNQASLNSTTATNFRAALINAGVSVPNTNVSGVYSFVVPPGATSLFTYLSTEINDRFTGRPLRLDEITIGVNKPSHNPMADFILRRIGFELDTQTPPRDSYAVGGAFVRNWLESIPGFDATGVVVADGSGLSTQNRYSARQTVDMIRYMRTRNARWEASLPISGVDGTLSNRLGGSLSGRVLAKTGTLPNGGVTSLAGFINHPLNNRRYFFAVYANTPSGPIAVNATRAGIDNVVRQLGDVLPPVGPDLYMLRALNSTTIRVDWTDRALAGESFRIFRSDDDGQTFSLIGETTATYLIESGAGGQNNSDYSEAGPFASSTEHSRAPGTTTGIGSRFILRTAGLGTATFTPSSLPQGRYRVDVTSFNFSSANAPNTRVRIIDRTGLRSSLMDIGIETTGDRWRSVGTIDFVPGQNHRIEFSNAEQLSTTANDRLNPAAVRFVPMTFDDTTFVPGTRPRYRVVSVGPRGLDSSPSDTYSVLPGNARSILVVDNFNRWNGQLALNPTGANHDFSARVARNLSLPFDMVADEAILEDAVLLDSYEAVIWNFGTESTVDRTFNTPLQTRFTNFLNGGGRAMVSGAEVGWDLGRVGAAAGDIAFLESVLRARRFTTGNPEDNAQTSVATGTGSGIFNGVPNFSFSGAGAPYSVNFPDILNPINGSQEALSYVGGRGGPAAITFSSGSQRLVFFGFPFETITSPAVQQDLMDRVIAFFNLTPSSVPDWTLFQ